MAVRVTLILAVYFACEFLVHLCMYFLNKCKFSVQLWKDCWANLGFFPHIRAEVAGFLVGSITSPTWVESFGETIKALFPTANIENDAVYL